MCLDLSNVSSGPVSMSMDYDLNTYYGYGAFRVLVDGVAIANLDGNLEETGAVAKSLFYDLAAYAGSNVTVTLQGVAKYDSNYGSGLVGDFIYIDNVCVSTVPPVVPGCTDSTATNYNVNATTDDGSCLYPLVNDDCANATSIACGDTCLLYTSPSPRDRG